MSDQLEVLEHVDEGDENAPSSASYSVNPHASPWGAEPKGRTTVIDASTPNGARRQKAKIKTKQR